LDKFQRITGKIPHEWIKRNIISHQKGFSDFLESYEQGKQVFIYTGMSLITDPLQVSQLAPFLFLKWLQDIFNCPVVIQITDEEKTLSSSSKTISIELVKDILACGFNFSKTFIFTNRNYRLNVKEFERLTSEFKMHVTLGEIKNLFPAYDDDSFVTLFDLVLYKTAALFSQSFPHIFNAEAHCLALFRNDEAKVIKIAADLAEKLKLLKQSAIVIQDFPPLTGFVDKKESSTEFKNDVPLYVRDSSEELTRKVEKHCFSGGGGNGTMEDHKKYGGNPEVDISYQYLKYFENDDNELQDNYDKFKKGELSCGDIKKKMVTKIYCLLCVIDEQRLKLSEESIKQYLDFNNLKI
jgi:tryptophanyl-tRNA synthetase